MAGYREFKAGSVWFYYNPYASKKLESERELGILTSRPVVIVQHAYYPEWTENITVCPITSSDRRTGIHIDTTVLGSGGIIEGGTILPYMLYTIKTRYLQPVSVSGRSQYLALLSLSDEDYEAVMEGVSYHLGFTREEPEYVKNWKVLDDYGRNVLAKSVRLAVLDFETQTQLYQHVVQPHDESDFVENHIISSMNRMNEERTEFIETPDTIDPSIRPFTFRRYYLDDEADNIALFEALEGFGIANEMFGREPEVTCFYEGSDKLRGFHSTDAIELLNPWEMRAFLELKGKEMLVMTGISSPSTAYRFRKVITAWLEDNPKAFSRGKHCFSCKNHHDNEIFVARCTINAKRWKFILGLTEVELQDILELTSEADFQERYPVDFKTKLSQVKEAICYYRPNLIVPTGTSTPEETPKSYELDETSTIYDGCISRVDRSKRNPKLEYWKTLSPQEIAEISSISKRNMGQACKKFHLSKSALKMVREQCIHATRNGDLNEVKMETVDAEGYKKLIDGNFDVDTSTIYLFCISNYTQIMDIFNRMGSSKCPSRSAIANVKARLRNIISVKPAG